MALPQVKQIDATYVETPPSPLLLVFFVFHFFLPNYDTGLRAFGVSSILKDCILIYLWMIDSLGRRWHSGWLGFPAPIQRTCRRYKGACSSRDSLLSDGLVFLTHFCMPRILSVHVDNLVYVHNGDESKPADRKVFYLASPAGYSCFSRFKGP